MDRVRQRQHAGNAIQWPISPRTRRRRGWHAADPPLPHPAPLLVWYNFHVHRIREPVPADHVLGTGAYMVHHTKRRLFGMQRSHPLRAAGLASKALAGLTRARGPVICARGCPPPAKDGE